MQDISGEVKKEPAHKDLMGRKILTGMKIKKGEK